MQETRKQAHGGQIRGMGQNEPSVECTTIAKNKFLNDVHNEQYQKPRSTAETIAREVGVSESTPAYFISNSSLLLLHLLILVALQ